MAISYNLLWKKLIDLGLSKTDMMRRAKISTNVLARLSKGEPVSMDSMEKICMCGVQPVRQEMNRIHLLCC